jgi:hypothetical protein
LRNLGLTLALGGAPEAGLLLIDSALAQRPDEEDEGSDAYMRGQRTIPLLHLGRFEEAAREAANAFASINRDTPEGHIYRADVAATSAIVALARGYPDEAEPLFRSALTQLEPILPPDHPLMSQAECGLSVSRAGGMGGPRIGMLPGSDPCTRYARWGLANPLLLRLAGISADDPDGS